MQPLLQTDPDDKGIPTVTKTWALQRASSHVSQASAQPLLPKHDEHVQRVVTEKVILQRATSMAHSYPAPVKH